MFDRCDDKTAEALLKEHGVKILHEDEYNAFHITVRRGHIFDDTLKALHYHFDENKHIRITSLGEAVIGDGGPR